VSKKRFAEGFNDLFGEMLEEDAQKKETKSKEKKKKRSSSRKAKRAPSKNFTQRFDALFEQTLFDKVYEKVEEVKDETEEEATSASDSPPPKGIDLLIRKTLQNSQVEVENPVDQKRVTFTFDKALLEKLKSIAKMEKKYLKDLIRKAVAEFIEEYEDQPTKSQD
jgi:hypothetical protein